MIECSWRTFIQIRVQVTYAISCCSMFEDRFNKPPTTFVLDQPSTIFSRKEPLPIAASGGTVSKSGSITEQNFISICSYLHQGYGKFSGVCVNKNVLQTSSWVNPIHSICMYWQQWHCSGQNILDRKGTLSWQWDNAKIPETVEMTYFGYAAASFLENLEISASLSFTSEPIRRNFLSLVGVKEDGFLGSNFNPCLIKSSSLHYMWLQKSRSVLTFLHSIDRKFCCCLSYQTTSIPMYLCRLLHTCWCRFWQPLDFLQLPHHIHLWKLWSLVECVIVRKSCQRFKFFRTRIGFCKLVSP